jgi:hypothetical protein
MDWIKLLFNYGLPRFSFSLFSSGKHARARLF